MRVDLHIHTDRSDGRLSPGAVVRAAARAGLGVIAITDHDTVDGVEAARNAAAATSVAVVAGCELTCTFDGGDLHLLGYGIDVSHPALADFSHRMSALRRARLVAMVERLRSLGVRISPEDVETPAGCRTVGRPHVARAMVRKGAVGSEAEAFDRFLADGRAAHLPVAGPPVETAIAAVRSAGGLGFWAHPPAGGERHLARLAAMGLEGVEAMRPTQAGTASPALERAARTAGLLVSGGSDWHGGPPPLGSWYVTEWQVGALLGRLGIG